MRKKVDPRIRMMIENGVKSQQRSMFVLVGDKGRDQVLVSALQFSCVQGLVHGKTPEPVTCWGWSAF